MQWSGGGWFMCLVVVIGFYDVWVVDLLNFVQFVKEFYIWPPIVASGIPLETIC